VDASSRPIVTFALTQAWLQEAQVALTGLIGIEAPYWTEDCDHISVADAVRALARDPQLLSWTVEDAEWAGVPDRIFPFPDTPFALSTANLLWWLEHIIQVIDIRARGYGKVMPAPWPGLPEPVEVARASIVVVRNQSIHIVGAPELLAHLLARDDVREVPAIEAFI
jgi:hypothetical protein